MIEPFKKKSITRLKKARGQIDGIIKMIEEAKYCGDILTQTLALSGSIKGVTKSVLESHLNTCGEHHLASKDAQKKEKFIKELLKLCDLSSR